MIALLVFAVSILGLSATALARPSAHPPQKYINWKTFKANGVNLGGWLVQEEFIDSSWWNQTCGDTHDEWNCCISLGAQCGPVLERRYATYFKPADIDKLASAGVNTLRIPTTYAAWVKVPGSELYSGNQVSFFKKIASYAISKYGMHIILDIHSLPGGTNGQGHGEAEGHFSWFNNQTNLDYSLKVVDAALEFIKCSDSPQSYSLAPINEPVDNHDITMFGTPASLSDNGVAWVQKYLNAAIAKTEAVDSKIPVMVQGGFRSAAFWSPRFPAGTNLVFDVHNYYFVGRPTDSDTVQADICSDAKSSASDSKFPVFVGEWSIQTAANNKFANRAKNLNTGLYAFGKFTQGSAYWSARVNGSGKVDGEGVQGDYWSYLSFIAMGIINPSQGRQYCL
ncbi:glycoside hydrolase family 5 protein [Dothidotthia symphoricarpi CBS 119687]|uniref:glucan 1,3-beta-glucosidase n=1 Tax=Dothidotthia symphoricarpi CBS 119687 TaxID=1392245 RepID=A0A6A6A7C5_9PLEO|nr:glycoside hydrolase family 5 protein [Dothidotthia symphoricarpi CBS 119687]KAF2127043.1 glycoside hydrolase family 5 protein [Dothidotthia symphoricarpi CBS 119687]